MGKKVTTKKKNGKPPETPSWMPRQQPLTDAGIRRFLYALMRNPNVSWACRHAKVNRTAVYQRKARDDEFARVFEECLQIGCDNLADKAFELAHEGWEEPVFYEGEECGTKRKWSPTLIIFLLKSHDPAKYRERFDIETAGKDGGPLSIEFVLDQKAVMEASKHE